MQHHCKQIVFRILLVSAIFASVSAKEIPVMEKVVIEVPVKEYSILKFPFNITNLQMGGFRYIKKNTQPNTQQPESKAIEKSGTKKINLGAQQNSAANPKSDATINTNNPLNIKKVDNMITLRPSMKGELEMIVWGNKDFPMIVNLKVLDVGDTNIEFVQLVESRKEVLDFEASAHEKVIERITRHLYNPDVNRKPGGYENVTRKEIYEVGIRDREGLTFARVRVELLREVVGRRYVGQEWNVNIVPEFEDEDGNTIEIQKDFYLNLYEEMFDNHGVFSVSLETYRITPKHGTRVIIVRTKENS